MELNSRCSGIKWNLKWSLIIPCEDSLKHLHQCSSDCHGSKDPPMSIVVNCLVAVSYEHQGESEFRYMALCMTPACSLCHDLRWIQPLSHVQLYVTPCTAACQASVAITNSQSLFKLMSMESVMPCNHLILYDPLLLLLSIIPSIRDFFNKSALHIRWLKNWSFSFSISSSNKHPGLISFRMDWLDLLAVQGTLKGLLQHHSSKASIFWCSAIFIVQLSLPYMTTGKTMALTIWTFVRRVMSLLFNMLSRFVITFLPRSKCLLISWLQSPSSVI